MKHFFDMMMTVMVGFVTGVFCGKGNALQFVKVLVSGQAAGAQTWLRSGCSEGPCSVREKSISGKLLQKMTSEEMHAADAEKRKVTAAEMRGKNSNRIRDVFYKRSNRIRDVFHKNSNRIRDVYFKNGLPYMRQSVCRGSPL